MPIVGLPCANASAWLWKPKSRVAGSFAVVVNVLMTAGLLS